MVQVCPAPALQSEITTGAPFLAEFPMSSTYFALLYPATIGPVLSSALAG